ncbi:MAG: TlpA family protein disulfide reductase [Planctomycetes bacterium]|nr:TlpA family protein disulfide reductase [Planctomycetota bacterium]
MNPHGPVLLLLALLVGAGAARAQEAVDPAKVAQEVNAILARPANTPIDPAKALPALDELLARHAGRDLGAAGYVPALRHYLARDYAAAATTLDAFFAKGHTIADPEHRTMCGRVYLNRLAQAVRGSEPLPRASAAWAEATAAIYPDLTAAARALRAVGRERKQEELATLRVALLRGALRAGRSAGEIDAFLQQLYGEATPPPRGATRGAAAAAPEAAPATLKPFTATAMSGATVDLAALQGKVVLVDFWATWCRPCMDEMPNVVALHRKYRDRGFTVVGISLDRPGAAAEIARVAKELGMEWEQIYDGGYWQAKLAVENDIRSIPATFLLDRQGKVRHARLRGGELAAAVARLVEER